MLNSSTTLKNRLANRRPTKVTNLELDNRLQPLLHDLLNNSYKGSIPSSTPILGEIDANLRSIKEYFLPFGGQNFDVKDLHGRTMLLKAVHMGYEGVVEYLVLHGANIYAQDHEGITPLIEANRTGKHKLATLMLEKHHVPRPKEILEGRVKEEDMMKKDKIKLAFALLNVGIELCQALLSQETSYRRLGVVLAFICLVFSVVEMVYEAKRDRVEWKKRGGCYWFYYPRRNGKVFGTLKLWFGLVSSIAQVCLNLATLETKRAVLKFDYMGLLLSVFYLMAWFGGRETTMRGVMKCGEHGESEIEGRIEHGGWVFECVHCRMGSLHV